MLSCPAFCLPSWWSLTWQCKHDAKSSSLCSLGVTFLPSFPSCSYTSNLTSDKIRGNMFGLCLLYVWNMFGNLHFSGWAGLPDVVGMIQGVGPRDGCSSLQNQPWTCNWSAYCVGNWAQNINKHIHLRITQKHIHWFCSGTRFCTHFVVPWVVPLDFVAYILSHNA